MEKKNTLTKLKGWNRKRVTESGTSLFEWAVGTAQDTMQHRSEMLRPALCCISHY